MTSRLYVGADRPSIGYHQRDLIVALVEGVLSLGGGERFDPRMTDEEREAP